MRTQTITLVPEPQPEMIWADRIAIAFWLMTGGLLGLVYANWGEPGAFKAFEEVAGAVTVSIWFIARVMDWTVTGRIRHSTL